MNKINEQNKITNSCWNEMKRSDVVKWMATVSFSHLNAYMMFKRALGILFLSKFFFFSYTSSDIENFTKF